MRGEISGGGRKGGTGGGVQEKRWHGKEDRSLE